MTLTVADEALYQGDDVTFPFTITDSTGAVRNISTATFKWTLSDVMGVVLTKTVGVGITIGDYTKGALTVSLTHTDTLALNPLAYSYMLSMDLTNVHSVEASGTLRVQRNTALM